jgi:UDP-hydrolysing UDP-N-acetyl-D-glucosamine 2-epimerase
VVLVDRANYGRLQPVMHAILAHESLSLRVVAAGTMPLERFGRAVEIVRADGFPVDAELHTELEGSTPLTMAKSVALAVDEFATAFARLTPDLVLLIGDRYETLGAALAAAYLNLPIVHLQGGEVSGSVDESARHAITKLAQFHVPATATAAKNLVERLGERPETILTVGCPSSDLARQTPRTFPIDAVNAHGSGRLFDGQERYVLAVFHPVTTEYGGETQQVNALLEALAEFSWPTLLFWPNIDAGGEHVAKAIRVFRGQHESAWLRTLTNLPPTDYLRVLACASCAVGNSSSFVRDAGYFGTPVVLVGSRQQGREHDHHVHPVGAARWSIGPGIRLQLAAGRYPASALYGDGFVAPRIAERLATLTTYVQKRLR